MAVGLPFSWWSHTAVAQKGERPMRNSRTAALLRGVVFAGLASCPLLAADLPSPDSGAGDFWALVLGMMLTIFGGMAFCYGLVKLGEKVVEGFHARHSAPLPVTHVRRAA